MKNFLFFIMLSSCLSVEAQIKEKATQSNISDFKFETIKERVPLLGVDSTLSVVFSSMVIQNLKCPYFIPNKSCFILSSSCQNGNILFYVRPTYTDLLDSASYFGVLNHENIKFFCYGEFNRSIFKELKSDSIDIFYYKPILKSVDDSIAYLSSRRLLCDGCLSNWVINYNSFKIFVKAEICNVGKSTRCP